MRKKGGILAVLLCMSVVFTAAACGGNNQDSSTDSGEPTHTHTYGETWSKDENYHWHQATCEHTAEIKDKAVHTYENGVCSVCGAEKEFENENGTSEEETSGDFGNAGVETSGGNTDNVGKDHK